jgi:3-deoxy-manno-octulosonate cytidylyltransferase (CMP-KDO synthetase)
METIVVIPARHASSRLPGKPLLDLCGKPIIVRVLEAVRGARHASRTVVATDDDRIAAAVREAGGEAVLTSPDHASGTDRVAEVVRELGAGAAVNVQGDEPFLDPSAVDLLVGALEEGAPLATLYEPVEAEAEWLDPSVCKIVLGDGGRVLYFSRAPVPGRQPGRGEGEEAWRGALRHVGVYAYTREALLRWASLPPTRLELREGLEQLRPLEAGMEMRALRSPGPTFGIDTEADLEEARRRWNQQGGPAEGARPGKG